MRIAIFSDIHGNKQALVSIIESIKKDKVDEVICLGDVIGIGPNPKECMDIIIDNNIKMTLGNHELYFLKGTGIDDELAEEEIEHQKWVSRQITDTQRKYLENSSMTIEKNYDGKKILFEHFLIDYNTKDQYPFYDLKIYKDDSVKSVLETLNYDLIFIGHEHKDFCIDNKLYDVGSSGCRKDNNTRYIIFDTETSSIEVKIINYDRESFIKNLLQREYPNRDLLAKWFFGVEI